MRRHIVLFATLLVAALFLGSGCNGDEVEATCDEETPCTGFGESCIQGQCVSGKCSTSAQCPMESHCESRECVPGCAADSDCYYGYVCDTETSECMAEGCEDTKLDCGYKEFCNEATGECYTAGGKYCAPCDPDNEVADCGSGNLCINRYCTVDCSGSRECPSGFECYEFQDSFTGEKYHQCFTYCHLYEDYEPGSFARAPESTDMPPVVETCDGRQLEVVGVAP